MKLTAKECEAVFALAEGLTGASQQGSLRKDIFISNVERRMDRFGSKDLVSYLKIVATNSDEYEQLVSSLTIHTTSWFREDSHFQVLETVLQDRIRKAPGKPLQIWSCACSTGQEAYSIGAVVDSFLKKNQFEVPYQIDCSDIDPVSVRKAQQGLYEATDLQAIPLQYHRYFLKVGAEKTSIQVQDDLKSHFQWFTTNLSDPQLQPPHNQYDVIFCRNVLIYFDSVAKQEVIDRLVDRLSPNGLLFLGHSDSFPGHPSLVTKGKACYQKSISPSKSSKAPSTPQKVAQRNLLILEDSLTIRRSLAQFLSPHFNVIEAASAEEATLRLEEHSIDVMTVDLNLPGENGASWLNRQRVSGCEIPAVIISDSNPSDAEKIFGNLTQGAQDYLVKSKIHTDKDHIVQVLKALTTIPHIGNQAQVMCPFNLTNFKPDLIAIGASTGGPQALAELLHQMPASLPPLLVVQHLNHEFSKTFAKQMSQIAGLPLGDLELDQPLRAGTLYIAQGDYHLEVEKRASDIYLKKGSTAKIHGHRPAVDRLFQTLAQNQIPSIGILLTGMGEDGANGLLQLAKTKKSYTMVQDAESSVVFAMPKKALELGAACTIGNPKWLRERLLKLVSGDD